MLKKDVLETILNKYMEIKQYYSKSLDVTSKILLLLGEKDVSELSAEFDERERNFYKAETNLKQAAELAAQYARDNSLKKFSFAEINKIDRESAAKIKSVCDETTGIIEEIQKADKKLNAYLEKSMNDIKSKITSIAATKNLKKKYGFNNINSGLINKNI